MKTLVCRVFITPPLWGCPRNVSKDAERWGTWYKWSRQTTNKPFLPHRGSAPRTPTIVGHKVQRSGRPEADYYGGSGEHNPLGKKQFQSTHKLCQDKGFRENTFFWKWHCPKCWELQCLAKKDLRVAPQQNKGFKHILEHSQQCPPQPDLIWTWSKNCRKSEIKPNSQIYQCNITVGGQKLLWICCKTYAVTSHLFSSVEAEPSLHSVHLWLGLQVWHPYRLLWVCFLQA